MPEFRAGRLATITSHQDTPYVEFYNVLPVDGRIGFSALWGSSNPEETVRFVRPISNPQHREYVTQAAKSMGFDVREREVGHEAYPDSLLRIIAEYGMSLDSRSTEQAQEYLGLFSLRDPYRSLEEFKKQHATHRLQTVWNLYEANVKSRVDVLARTIGEATRWPMTDRADARDYVNHLQAITGLQVSALTDDVYEMHRDHRWNQPGALKQSLGAVKKQLLHALREA